MFHIPKKGFLKQIITLSGEEKGRVPWFCEGNRLYPIMLTVMLVIYGMGKCQKSGMAAAFKGLWSVGQGSLGASLVITYLRSNDV